jgi:hypothetical protein
MKFTQEFFTYTDAQWNQIREQVLDDLAVDVDRIERQITPKVGNFSYTGMEPLRDRIETVASLYHFRSAVSRQSPRRDELDALCREAKNLRASIIGAVAVQVGTNTKYKHAFPTFPVLLNGVDADMLTETDDYFRKLLSNLDRMIAQAGSSRDNARKTARDQCWTELRSIWIELGGKPRGIAAAEFIKLASLPVMNSAVPDLASIIQWLKRRPAQ